MSVPRPAMLVAIVTAPFWPASATISASRAWFFALRTLCGMPARVKSRERISDVSTETVPIRTGWPLRWHSATSSMIALYFSRCVLYIRSLRSTRRMGRFVGIATTSRW